jgi:ribosomal protein S2
MEKYVYGKNKNGIYLLDVVKIYEKIKVAARIIASINDPNLIIVKFFVNPRPSLGEKLVKELFINSVN